MGRISSCGREISIEGYTLKKYLLSIEIFLWRTAARKLKNILIF